MSKILVVDDIKLNCDLLQAFLEGRGHKVAIASNGSEALDLARADQPDMIVSDILMPVMDGFALCREWKKDATLSNIPFVFYTATYTDAKDEALALQLGAERFLIKPMELKAFHSIIDEILKDSEVGKLRARPAHVHNEASLFKEYNEVLVRKLEDKMLQLQKSEFLFRSIVDESVDGIVLTDHTGRIIVWNAGEERITGIPTSEALGQFLWDIQLQLLPKDTRRPGTAERLRATIEEVLRGDNLSLEDQLSEIEIQQTDGEHRVVQMANFTIGTSEPLMLGTIARDITERKHAQEKLEEALAGSLKALGHVTEARDPYTSGHQHRVAALASAIAEQMDLTQDRVAAIHAAGLIHDVGKVSIPAELLSKPSRLSETEMALIRAHAQVGHDTLAAIEFPWDLATIVLQHHERIDGSGYPNRLTGESTLLEARVLAVADVVEAMSSHRPYRPALGTDHALGEISEGRGKLYDSDVVEACLQVFHNGFDWP